MKAAPFDYSRPASVEAARELLARDDDARVIAGGQTLVPMMAMRLARPTRLIDIARIPELCFIRHDRGHVSLGATTRQAMAEKSPMIGAKLPLLARALPWVGHAPTRNRGTIGGSIANADPAAEIPLVLTTLGGEVIALDDAGPRVIAAADFFEGPMATTLSQRSLLTEARFPVWKHDRVGAAFLEISARHGDFAYVMAAAQVALDEDGKCITCAVGVGGGTPVPTRLAGAGALIGHAIGEANVNAALADDIAALEIMTDPHASPAYRRRVSTTLARRALIAARDAAMEARP